MALTPERKARYNEARNAKLRAQTAAREATGLTRNRHGLTLYVQRQASRRGWLSYRSWENAGLADVFPDITLVKDGRLLFAYVRQSRWLTLAQ